MNGLTPLAHSVLVSEGLSGEPHDSRHWRQKDGGEGSLHLRGKKGADISKVGVTFHGEGAGLPGPGRGRQSSFFQIPQPPPPRARCAQQCARSTQSLQMSTSPGTHGACQERSPARELSAPAPTCLPIPQTLPSQAGGRPHALNHNGFLSTRREVGGAAAAGGCVPGGGRQTDCHPSGKTAVRRQRIPDT